MSARQDDTSQQYTPLVGLRKATIEQSEVNLSRSFFLSFYLFSVYLRSRNYNKIGHHPARITMTSTTISQQGSESKPTTNPLSRISEDEPVDRFIALLDCLDKGAKLHSIEFDLGDEISSLQTNLEERENELERMRDVSFGLSLSTKDRYDHEQNVFSHKDIWYDQYECPYHAKIREFADIARRAEVPLLRDGLRVLSRGRLKRPNLRFVLTQTQKGVQRIKCK